MAEHDEDEEMGKEEEEPKKEVSEDKKDEEEAPGSESLSQGDKDEVEDRERVTKVIEVDKDDAAFVLGRGGSTKRKVARVSGCDIELDEHELTVTISGEKSQCEKAVDYINFIRQQRVGPVSIDGSQTRDDFTAYPVPPDCIGFVMGRNGQTLRSMEEEWGVLMFFAKINNCDLYDDDAELLCIFGPLSSRRGAELKTMSAVEHKHVGYCITPDGELVDVKRIKGDEDDEGWATDTMALGDDNFSYALGAQGSTRKKLAAASGCIIEYVGKLACFAGYKKDRRRGKDYLRWLLEQRTGQSDVSDPHSRDDCTIVKIPASAIAFITGSRGEALRSVERESSTFCFTDGDRNDTTKEHENLLIFSYSRSARKHAAEIVEDRVAAYGRGERPRYGDGGGGYGGPSSTRDQPCWDFGKGRCTRGANCKFSHGDFGGYGDGGGYDRGYGGGYDRGYGDRYDRDRYDRDRHDRDRYDRDRYDRDRYDDRRRDKSRSRSRERSRRRRRDDYSDDSEEDRRRRRR